MTRRRNGSWRRAASRALLCACVAVALAGCAKHNTRDAADSERDGGMSEVVLADGVVGKRCMRDAECGGGTCADSLQIDSATDPKSAPGGYCTVSCVRDTACGMGGECLVAAGESRGECLSSCEVQDDCREGYLCVGASRAVGFPVSGTCRPRPETDSLGAGITGRACEADADCEGGRCASRSPLGMSFPGNYCSGRCFEDAECGASGACLVFTGSVDAGHCYQVCASDLDCTRDGYRCRELGPDFLACYPAPQPLPDLTAGLSCTSDADCGGQPDTCASQLPFFMSNDIVPARGGYCTQRCSLDDDCGEGAQCISRATGGGFCFARCESMSDCRAGYECLLHGRDLDDASVCMPLAPDAP